jgi:hypothetical protein
MKVILLFLVLSFNLNTFASGKNCSQHYCKNQITSISDYVSLAATINLASKS